MGVLFGPLLFIDELTSGIRDWGLASIVGVTFFLGQLFTFIAVKCGDVSLATPILGTKVLFVAVFSYFLFGESFPTVWWIGAGLTAVAIFLLGGSDLQRMASHLPVILLSMTSAMFFGLTDAMLAHYAPGNSPFSFLAIMFLVNAGLSFFLIPFFNGRLRDISRKAWPWLGFGAFLLSAQSLILGITLAVYGSATAVNILYGIRGLWSLVLVFLIGKWLQSTEKGYGLKTVIMRYTGALLLLFAIAIVMAFSS